MNRTAPSIGRSRIGREVIDSLSIGVVVADRRGIIVEWNDAASRLLKLDDARSAGRPAADVLPDGVVRAVLLETSADGRGVAERIGPAVEGDSPGVMVRCRSTVLRGEGGGRIGAACHFEDVSDIARLEREVENLDRLAMMGRFASSVAHEIRNPLMGIYAGVQYLEKTLDLETNEQETTFRIIRDEVDRLNRLVTDLLGAARPPEIEYAVVDPKEICAKVVALARREADEAKVNLSLQCDPTLPPISIDPDLACQVLLNLARNAVQASPGGGEVRIATRPSAASPRSGILPAAEKPAAMEFVVTDEGPGVPEEDGETIFRPFHSTKKKGTGLGLYISFQIVERHGGALWLERNTSKGATFVARFPYTPPGK